MLILMKKVITIGHFKYKNILCTIIIYYMNTIIIIVDIV